MLSRIKQNLAILCCVVLAACGSGVDATQTVAGPLPYTVTSVEVTATDTAAKGRFAKDDALKADTLATLDATLTKSLSEIPGGDDRAKALFRVDEMKLKEATARSFGGINAMRAVMQIVDERGNTLAKPTLVNYSDQAANTQIAINYVPVGLLFNQIRNSTDATAGEDVKTLVGGFTQLAHQTLLTTSGATTKRVSGAATAKRSSSAVDTSTSKDGLSEPELEAEIEKAQRKAEAKVLSKYGVACWSIICDREVERAKKEAEARVRQSAALATN